MLEEIAQFACLIISRFIYIRSSSVTCDYNILLIIDFNRFVLFHHFFFFLFFFFRSFERSKVVPSYQDRSSPRLIVFSSLVKYESLPRCVIVEKVPSIASVRVLTQLISITLFDYCRSSIERVSLQVLIFR